MSGSGKLQRLSLFDSIRFFFEGFSVYVKQKTYITIHFFHFLAFKLFKLSAYFKFLFQVIHVYEKSLVQSLSVVLLMTMATVGYAADKKKTAEKKTENENVVEVTPTKGTTPEELAAIQVLSEICPSLIGKKMLNLPKVMSAL